MIDKNSKLILIIEDESSIARMYKMKLELAGYKVEIAPDGESSLNIINSTRPDLVLLDVMMPRMNGDEVLQKIRSGSASANLPVMVLTNVGSDELQQRLESMGVVDYIQKADLTPKQVLARVDAFFRAQ